VRARGKALGRPRETSYDVELAESLPRVVESVMPSVAQVVLKPASYRHSWGDTPGCSIRRSRGCGESEDGAAVDLLADGGQWIARGIYNRRSRIRVRLYTWSRDESLDEGSGEPTGHSDPTSPGSWL